MIEPYDDIIRLPHHISAVRPQMPMTDRAAQFSPFAALTGYEDAVAETARLTESRIELDEAQKLRIGEKLALLQEHIGEAPAVTVIWFRPDKKKNGGAYTASSGTIRKIDELEQRLLMSDGTRIPMSDIYNIEGELLTALDP